MPLEEDPAAATLRSLAPLEEEGMEEEGLEEDRREME